MLICFRVVRGAFRSINLEPTQGHTVLLASAAALMGWTPPDGNPRVITHACDAWVQALTVLRMVAKELAPGHRHGNLT